MLNLILILIATIASAQSNYVGFSRGNTFTAVPVQGQVQVTCSGFNGEGSAIYTCRDVILEPVAYDFFLGPKDPKLKWVELISLRQDGSTRNKTVSYDGFKGASDEALNLWISTLFQKGLLSTGSNQVTYKLYADGNVPVQTGRFQAVVNRAPSRQCQTGHYTSPDINDCNSQYSICQRYFSENQFCR